MSISGLRLETNVPQDEPNHDEAQDPIPSSPSRVPVSFFDPVGVSELKRTMTTRSTRSQVNRRESSRRASSQKAVMPDSPKEVHTPSSSSVTSGRGADEDGFDFELTLKDLVRRRGEESIKSRELGVMFKDLRVIGVGARSSLQPTIGSMFNPAAILRNISAMRNPPVRDILSGFEGVVAPGEMLLVLGRPGSGCSTFLKTIANQRGEYHAVQGEVCYDSFTPEDIARQYRGDVIYCPEDDVHFPTLTVEQTLSFAIKTRTPHARFTDQSREQYNRDVVDILVRIFGLRHARNTVVGDAAIRGVSGGEKKRVSIAEALSCRALIGAWDNSTRGLDASTALEFVQALRIGTDIGRLTTIVSIYQAGEQLYNLFDKVCVISEGRMVFFGPAKDARRYFIDMGYEPQDRQTTADFLVSVTNPSGRCIRDGFEGKVPGTAEEMAAAFLASSLGQANRDSIENYRSHYVGNPERMDAYRQSVGMEHADTAPKSNSYTISIAMQMRAVMVRRVQIIKGDWGTVAVNLVVQIFQSIIMGTVFLKLPDATSGFFSRGGVLFFALFFGALSSMAEIPALFAQRPIVLRHHKAAMYYPFIESFAHTMVDIPFTFVIQAVFSVILYLLVDLQRTSSQFFIFFLFVFAMTITMKAFFRMVAACFKTESAATSLAGVVVVVVALFTGYTIPKPNIPGALRWIMYINPVRYGFEALLMNEFHTLSGTCSTLVPSGPAYPNISLTNQVCAVVGAQPGQNFVNGNLFAELSYTYYYSNLWRNFGIVCVFCVGFLAILFTATEFNTATAFDTAVTLFKQGSRAAMVVDESKDEEKGAHPEPAGPANTDASPADLEKPSATDIFTWRHLEYTVPISGGQYRRLLDDVSGFVAPGKLTALMGESGAGKTTLLNVLAQRVDVGVVTGDRLVSGQPLPADFQAQTGYCQQMDTHLPQATVREALLFSAHLRQPQTVPMAELEEYVDKCLVMCGLEDYADAVVGSLGVEHRKRTTIGVELAAKPKLLLFLDEPTSGLDSQSAWAIMKFLRELANNGQAILCTIHQPSGELFQVFDRLLLLKKGGQTVYFGKIGEGSSTMLEYFDRNGAPRCDPDANPAEYMLDVIGAGATASSSVDWHTIWKNSPEAAALQEEIENFHNEGLARPVIQAEQPTEFVTSWSHQLMALTQRNFQAYWRNPTYLMAKFALCIAGGLLIGFTFYQTSDSLQGTQNKLFAIFLASVLCVPLSQQLQTMFIDIRSIYEIRERPSRMYNWTALVVSQILVELPWNIMCSSLFFFCWYWTVGFPTDRAGYTYLMYGVVFPMYYTTVAQAVASMAPTAVIASLLFSALFSFVVIFNGVMQPYRALGWWQWMYRVSPFTYFIEGLLGQAIGGNNINCAPHEFVPVIPPSGSTCSQYLDPFMSYAGGYLADPSATSTCFFCPYRTTDEYMFSAFNIKASHDWRDLGIMMGITAFNVFAIFTLTYICRIRKGNPLAGLQQKFASLRK
ncbi:ABC-2 type transporter-domain-containing protein [Suillus clintonianus]|uniref:ABC-2 type transporter-domain-containing protein n=1 Tax=Suillus clintonianus TaxID=1904413 RepID=UPI001B87212F|nr:ABC-2 type transporter-domain-containing protein [Suillus clintonianus]KAG2131009.1 ABC-2 type transporter-domain-containing protein [Suillus clintonianus]